MAYCQGIQAGLQVQTIKYQTPKVHIKLHAHTHTHTHTHMHVQAHTNTYAAADDDT